MKALITFFLIFGFIGFAHGKDNQAKQLSNAELRHDLQVLFTTLKGAHADLFVNRSAIDYQKKYDEIDSQLSEQLDDLQVKMLFQEFVAYGRIAHAGIDFIDDEFTNYRNQGGKAFPVYVRIENGIWRVSENFSKQDLSERERITHINDISVDVIFNNIWRYLSADTREIASSLLEYKLPQYLWLLNRGEAKSSNVYKLSVERNGKLRHVEVEAISRDELQTRIDTQSPNEKSQNQALRDYKLLESNIGYLKPGPFYNAEDQNDLWNNSQFVSFIDEAFNHFIANEVQQLIIDVRKNPGGTNSFSDAMIAWYATEPFKFASQFIVRSSQEAEKSNQDRIDSSNAEIDSASAQLAEAYKKHQYGSTFEFELEDASPRGGKRFMGDVYVLIDRHSYSNAASVAAITQDYEFGLVIGETTTDFATTYASMETFVLPNTNLRVGFPKAHIIRPSGDRKAGPVIPSVKLNGLDEAVELILGKN